MKTLRNKIFVIIKVIVAVSIFIYIFNKNKINLSELSQIKIGYGIIPIAFILILSLMIISYRLKLILSLSNNYIKYSDSIRFTQIGMFYDIISPVSNGGDAVKAIYIKRFYGFKIKDIFFGILSDRIYSLIGILAIFLPTILILNFDNELTVLVKHIAIITLVTFILMFIVLNINYIYTKTKKLISKYSTDINKIKILHQIRKIISFEVLAISSVNIILWSAIYLIVLKENSIPASLSQSVLIISVGLLVGTFGVFGGFGPGTLALDYMYDQTIGIGNSVSITLTYQFIILINKLMMFYVVFMVDGKKQC